MSFASLYTVPGIYLMLTVSRYSLYYMLFTRALSFNNAGLVTLHTPVLTLHMEYQWSLEEFYILLMDIAIGYEEYPLQVRLIEVLIAIMVD